MGIFNGYVKPGKGVEKDEPEKSGFFLFWDVIIHKFGKFLGANCLYTLSSVIWLAFVYFFTSIIINNTGIADRIAAALYDAKLTISITETKNSIIFMLQPMLTVLIFVLWGSGPSSAAYAYIARCFTNHEHVWILSDGKDKFKENFKQGIAVVIIDALVLVFAINAAIYYHSVYVSTQNLIWLVLTYGTIVAFIIYTMMHPYIYQIMVTFECSMIDIYKNAFLLSIGRLPGNFSGIVISVIIIFSLFSILNPIVASIAATIIGLCFTRYVCEFHSIEVIKRSISKTSNPKLPEIEYEDDNLE